MSEPADLKIKIIGSDEAIYREHLEETSNWTWHKYPQIFEGEETGSWVWDGRGSFNQKVGGMYSYYLEMTDNVGNFSTSETKTIESDCAPTLSNFIFAAPDPFSPVNPDNGFTEFKYSLTRDNVRIRLWVIGQEGRTAKTVIDNEIQSTQS